MGQDNSLWIPFDHLRNNITQLRFVLGKSHSHVTWHLPVGILDAAEPGKPAQEQRPQLRALEVLDQVGQNQGAAGLMEKSNSVMKLPSTRTVSICSSHG